MKITTREELVEFISNNKGNEYITLYEAYGSIKQVGVINMKSNGIHIGKLLHYGVEMEGEFLFHQTDYGYDQNSLGDRNIGAHYNDNWWFTTKEEAEDYIKPKQFEVNKIYQYNRVIWGNSLTCVYVSNTQGVFVSDYDNDLYIISKEHLRDGTIKRIGYVCA